LIIVDVSVSDDILEVIKKHGADGLTQHLNSVDDTGSINFTAEQEQDEQMPFLDTLIVQKADGRVKLLVYRKKTHTDHYLHFSSHRPLQHKLSVVRTLLDRSSHIVTEEEDREQEEHHIHTALTRCGYPDWSINQVKSQMLTPKMKKTTHTYTYIHKSFIKMMTKRIKLKIRYTIIRKRIRQLSDEPKSTVVIPYMQDLSEAVSRVTTPRYSYSHETIPVDT